MAPLQPSAVETPQVLKKASKQLLVRVSALSLLGVSLGGVWGLLDHHQFRAYTSQLGQTLMTRFSQNLDYLTTSSPDPSLAETNLTEILPEPPEIPSPNLPSSITIKAVGDIIPGTNYPSHRLPPTPGFSLPKSSKSFRGLIFYLVTMKVP